VAIIIYLVQVQFFYVLKKYSLLLNPVLADFNL
jgi:hypothetical protein